MTADRAALVEKVAQMFCSQVDLECSECKTEGGCWYADIAIAAVSLIRAEVLEEAARVIENNCHDDMTRAEEAAAIRARKGDSNDV